VNRTIQAMLAEGDTRLYSDDGTSIELTDSPDAMEALAYHVDLAKTGATWSPLNPDPSWGGDDFMKNKAAIAVYGYWFSGYMTTEPSSAVGENYTMLVGPHWDDEAARVNPTVTATGYVISRETEQEEAAWTFLEWFLGGKAAEDRAKTGYGVPAQESLYDLMPETTAVQKQVQAVLQQEMPRAERLDFNPYYDDAVFGTSYNANLEKHLRGEISMDELAANVEKDVNASIEEGVQRAQDAE
jgi:multiple sugar transport system substrate-binding protein